ncbi:hypothetical protein JD844_022204 [Phrynosoma platyrhinos]|uniref:DNA polymerase delta subunit 4 n=1 Tax=Phrynosoma platyrhinos TaxID=52577 RepID=A0ABQ7SVQ4_PHRPL|nr:hypothetical protein JD844_022204 [Phrynosoma platyrhinos]
MWRIPFPSHLANLGSGTYLGDELPGGTMSPRSAIHASWASHGAMGRKRLITDSFQVVKKRKRGRKEEKESQSPTHETDTVQAKSPLQDTALPDQVELLKQFDLSWQYGPCTGITRLQRWERAELLGLSPPVNVKELLLKHNQDPLVIYSLWYEYSI